MELFQPVNKEEMHELEYQHFIAPNELMVMMVMMINSN